MSTDLGIRTSLLAPGDTLLRLSLRVDAVVTGVNGLAYLALSGPIESLLGLDRGIGIAIGGCHRGQRRLGGGQCDRRRRPRPHRCRCGVGGVAGPCRGSVRRSAVSRTASGPLTDARGPAPPRRPSGRRFPGHGGSTGAATSDPPDGFGGDDAGASGRGLLRPTEYSDTQEVSSQQRCVMTYAISGPCGGGSAPCTAVAAAPPSSNGRCGRFPTAVPSRIPSPAIGPRRSP